MEVMTAAEVANYLKVNRETVYRSARAGEIPHFKVSGKILFRKSTIDNWIAEQENNALHNSEDYVNVLRFRKTIG